MGMKSKVNKFVHWCGNCQIRIYIERHYGKRLSWVDCPYVCKYKDNMFHLTDTVDEVKKNETN